MEPLPITLAWSLLSPEAEPRVELFRWKQQARTFFAAELECVQTLSDPVLPNVAALELDVTHASDRDAVTRVRVITLPVADCAEVLRAADAGVAAIGGAGFDHLVGKAKRVWQVDARLVNGSDARVPLVIAGVLASVLLSPIVPPDCITIFGVKGARVRLEKLHWPDR